MAVVSTVDDNGANNAQPITSSLVATRAATSPAAITFVLQDEDGDAADVELLFRTVSSDPFAPITLAAGSAPLSGAPSSSTPYQVLWDFAADLGGNAYREGMELQLVVRQGIAPPVLTGVTQGNDAPMILFAAASPAAPE